jgi:triphosphatase
MGAPALPSRGHTEDIEVEWQFDALDLRPVERWLARLAGGAGLSAGAPGTPENPGWRTFSSGPVSIVDRYLDTEDWRIGRAGYVLRLRHKARGDEITLKGLSDSAPADGLRRRVEITEKTAEGAEWLNLAGPVGSRVSAMIGRRPLRHVIEVRTERRPYAVWIGETEVAELAMDETVIAAYNDEPPARLCRVEVEVEAGWTDVLVPLVEDLRLSAGLWPARLSKFEAGLLAHGMAVPGRPDLGDVSVTPASSFGELADAVIRRHLATLIANEPGTRLGEDPEGLHDMRVATRRLRAAFSFFKEILPPQFSVLRTELSWLASILGAVRDLDVHLETLEGAEEQLVALPEGTEPPLDRLRAVLTEERQLARAVLLGALDSPRYERLTTGLASLAQQGAARRTAEYDVAAVRVVPGLIGARYRSTLRAARHARRSGRATDFHRLRIRGKRLRYAVEFADDLYGEPAQRFSRRLARLQDALGSVQDASVATERLLRLAADGDRPLPPITVFVMGALAARHQLESARLMERIPDRLSQFEDREWEDLARVMEERRRAAERDQAWPGGRGGIPAPSSDEQPVDEQSVAEHQPTPEPVAEHQPTPEPVAEHQPTPEPVAERQPVSEPVAERQPVSEPAGHVWTAVEPGPIDPARDLPRATGEPDPAPRDPLGQIGGAAPASNGYGHHGPAPSTQP